MTPDDQKASKKFVCASELARMFKSMICLFLTTSFLILNIKPGSSQLDSTAVQEEENFTEKNFDDVEQEELETPVLQPSFETAVETAENSGSDAMAEEALLMEQ